jgi:HEAT repeat protein
VGLLNKKKVASQQDVREIGRRKGIKGLVKLVCNSSDPWIAGLAAQELGDHGASGRQALAQLLTDDDREVRLHAAHQFGQRWSYVLDVGFEPFIAALGDEYWEVRNAAASALSVAGRGEVVDERVTEALLAALKDDNGNIRFSAADYFYFVHDVRAVEPLISVLTESKSYGDDRKAAAKALGAIGGDRAMEVLNQVANDPDEDDSVKRAAAFASEHGS